MIFSPSVSLSLSLSLSQYLSPCLSENMKTKIKKIYIYIFSFKKCFFFYIDFCFWLLISVWIFCFYMQCVCRFYLQIILYFYMLFGFCFSCTDGEMPCFGRFDDDLYFSLTQHRLGSLLLILNKRFLHLLTLFDNGYLSFAQ